LFVVGKKHFPDFLVLDYNSQGKTLSIKKRWSMVFFHLKLKKKSLSKKYIRIVVKHYFILIYTDINILIKIL